MKKIAYYGLFSKVRDIISTWRQSRTFTFVFSTAQTRENGFQVTISTLQLIHLVVWVLLLSTDHSGKMSKLSFRARALDASKPMPVFCSEEIPDLPDFAAINRAVPQMPTGMEKEEECEHHLQRAISAQQAFGHTGELVIPTPEVYTAAVEEYELLYPTNYKAPRQMIHMQPFSMDQDIPDYDMDSEDEKWINQQTRKMEITPLQFEEIMDRLEKSSGQQVVTLKEAKLLLKEDDDLIIAVYDYWLNKRLKMQHPLIPQVKTEKRDGSTNNNPYVAFRRRTEKMQTRKNRKNDEASYEKMLKLRRDLSRAVTLLEMVKRREKTKREHLHLTIEIFEKRYQAGDFSGQILAEVSALKHTRPNYLTVNNNQVIKQEGRVSKHKDDGVPRKKREYTKRKNKQGSLATQLHAPQRSEIETGFSDLLSSEDEGLSPATSPSDQEEDNDPDGQFAFRRKRYCNYHAPLVERLGNWPWCSPEEGGLGDKRYRFCLTSLSLPRPKCIGFARRRIGRGGRVILDRTWTPLDDYWADLDFSISHSLPNGLPSSEFLSEIKNEWVHFRPQTPHPAECNETTHLVEEEEHALQCPTEETTVSLDSVPTEFDLESFQSHQEELFEMQRKQLERLKQDEHTSDAPHTSEHSFISQPTSRFTLDSASVQFAVSAVLSTSELSGILNSLTSHAPPSVAVTNNNTSSTACRRHITNGPTIANVEENVSIVQSGACKDSSLVAETDSIIEFALPGGVPSSLPPCIQVAPSTELESGCSISNTSNSQSLGVVSIKGIIPTPVQPGLRVPSMELNGSEKQSATSDDFSLSKVKLEPVTTDCGFPMDVT